MTKRHYIAFFASKLTGEKLEKSNNVSAIFLWFQKRHLLRQFITIRPSGFEDLTMALKGSLKMSKSLPFGFFR